MKARPQNITPPNDLVACQDLIKSLSQTLATQETTLATQETTLATQNKTIDALTKEKLELELAYAKLLQRAFGNRSERYLDNPDQLRLDFKNSDDAADAANGLAEAVDEVEQTIPEHQRCRPRKPRNEKLPEHLPRREVIAEVSEEEQNCDEHGPRKLIGYDTTESLKFKRPELWVLVTKYPKYACQSTPECGIASPERPTSLVEGNRYDTSIAAEVITGKYGYHLPIYRQQDYFASSGWTPSRSTLLNLLTASFFVLEPLLEFFKKTVLSDPVLGTDETTVTLLLPQNIPKFDLDDPKEKRIHEVFTKAENKNKRSVTARMWAYRGVNIALNVFDFTVSRHRDGPEWFLETYEGKLMADCWSGFEAISLGSNGLIERGACVAHARRKVKDSMHTYPDDSPRIMRWFQQLYDIEDRGKEMSVEERLLLRQTEAKPIWDRFGEWLAEVRLRNEQVILPRSDFGKALQYIRNHWEALQLYLTDGRMPMDNNDTEQLMKQVAVGRKNWLFVGSVPAGERAAGFMTLVSSALRNDLDVWAYVKDVLDQLLAGSTDYESLLPWVWKAAHPEAVRQYRQRERQDRSDRKRKRRQKNREK